MNPRKKFKAKFLKTLEDAKAKDENRQKDKENVINFKLKTALSAAQPLLEEYCKLLIANEATAVPTLESKLQNGFIRALQIVATAALLVYGGVYIHLKKQLWDLEKNLSVQEKSTQAAQTAWREAQAEVGKAHKQRDALAGKLDQAIQENQALKRQLEAIKPNQDWDVGYAGNSWLAITLFQGRYVKFEVPHKLSRRPVGKPSSTPANKPAL